MNDVDPRIWAEAVAKALTVGGERVPFQRVLRAHRSGLDALRARGLTWRSLAHLLAQAGVRRPDGPPYGADHLRVCVKRMGAPPRGNRPIPTRAPSDLRPPHPATMSATLPRGGGTPPARPPPPSAPRPPAPQVISTPTDKDVSDDELALARARLNQLRQ